jgi:hypothetical protein
MYVVEKSQGEFDTLRSAARDLAPAYLADKRAKNDCVEKNLRKGEEVQEIKHERK